MLNFVKRIASKANSIGVSLKYQMLRRDEQSIIDQMGHRQFIGKEYEQEGRRQFEVVRQLGVTQQTRFLDVACGSLRLGRHLIPYLEAGAYFGIEQHQALVDAGLKYEIDADVVTEKLPTFYVNSEFDLGDLQDIEIAWANSLFSHLVEKDILICLANVEKALANGGVFYTTFFEGKRNRFTQMFGSHSLVGFLYTKEQMMHFGRTAGFEARYLEDVKNSRGQSTMAFKKVIGLS